MSTIWKKGKCNVNLYGWCALYITNSSINTVDINSLPNHYTVWFHHLTYIEMGSWLPSNIFLVVLRLPVHLPLSERRSCLLIKKFYDFIMSVCLVLQHLKIETQSYWIVFIYDLGWFELDDVTHSLISNDIAGVVPVTRCEGPCSSIQTIDLLTKRLVSNCPVSSTWCGFKSGFYGFDKLFLFHTIDFPATLFLSGA